MYLTIKYIHIACVILTIAIFFVRGLLMIAESAYAQRKWLRVVPPIIDTCLLVSAVMLTLQIEQYPFTHSWLTAKLLALVIYIALGMVGITYGKTRKTRVVAWLAALLTFIYIVMVAITKNPTILI